MNILFLGALYSQDKIKEYMKNSKFGLQYAAQNLQESIIEGILENNVSVEVVSKPILSTFPHGFRRIIIKDCDFLYKGNVLGKSLGFLNIPFLNSPSDKKYLSIIDKWYEKHNNEKNKSIWVYSLSKKLMHIAVLAKKKYPDIIIVQIVPDLPRFCGCNIYYKKLGIQNKNIKNIYRLIQRFDRYVLLCENMAEDLGIKHKRYTVVEGIFSPERNDSEVEKESKKVILYTGNLDARYGIVELLNAFARIKDPEYRLWIRGNGSTENLIRQYMATDNRIVLIPQLSKNDLFNLEKKASLLVNPVSYKQEFTNYFFPSKTMDYMASGTPTMMHPLSCLPLEYKKYLYFFSGDSPEQMSKDIIDFFSLNNLDRMFRGRKAAEFIIANKIPKKQVKKIIDLL